ncbi:MAG: hypothetical protein QCI00_10060 [Candidatus Thermoplasmatota archaeon]|nr:hypothetical protein [Candidatus Thermoplasmatota archaeon]
MMSKNKYTSEQEAKYLDYLNELRARDSRGEKIPDDFPDKPSGFIEWLDDNPEYKLRLKRKEVEPITCWNCGKEYPIDYKRCPNPNCKAFNKYANKNR